MQTGGDLVVVIDAVSPWTRGNGYTIHTYTTNSIVANSYYYVVLTWNQSTDNIKGYLNGVTMFDESQMIGRWNAPFSDFVIGKGYSGESARHFSGLIDQVRVYNYARTPAQIAWEYNRGAPVAHYQFDECQGSTAYNNAVNGNGDAAGNNGTITIGATGTNTSAGTCTGASTEAWKNGATGKINSSLSFDGNDDYVNVGTPLNSTSSETKTVGAWIYPTSASASYIISNYDPNSQGFSILFNSDRTVGIAWTGTVNAVRTSTTVSLNTWTHVLAVYDSSDNTGKIYINGVLNKNGSLGAEQTSTNNLRISGRWTSPNSGSAVLFSGQLDDVRIYNYALTNKQVQEVYNNGAVNFR